MKKLLLLLKMYLPFISRNLLILITLLFIYIYFDLPQALCENINHQLSETSDSYLSESTKQTIVIVIVFTILSLCLMGYEYAFNYDLVTGKTTSTT